MKNRAICKRCHRIRVVDQVGYCERCGEELREAERPRDVRAAAFTSTPDVVTVSGEAHSTSSVLDGMPPLLLDALVNPNPSLIDAIAEIEGAYTELTDGMLAQRVYTQIYSEPLSFELAEDGFCELCIDPIDKPFVDEDGTKRFRACPNKATREVAQTGTKVPRTLRVCEEHFTKETS
jgi:hypothetical protein